jgi:hypothetical protein
MGTLPLGTITRELHDMTTPTGGVPSWQTAAEGEIKARESGMALIQTSPGVYEPRQVRNPAPLSTSEKIAIYDAHRAAEGFGPDKPDYGQTMAGQQEQQQAQHVANQGAVQNFSAAGAAGLGRFGTGLVGTVAPQTAAGMQANQNATYQYDPDRLSGKLGSFVGQTLPLVPAMVPGAGGLVGTGVAGAAGLSQFGAVRQDVAQRRAQGEQISTGAELAAAGAQAATMFLAQKVGLSRLGGPGKVLGAPVLSAVEQQSMRAIVESTVAKYAANAGIQGSDFMLMQAANNGINKALVDHEQSIGQGVGEAGRAGILTGLLGTALHGAGGAPQQKHTEIPVPSAETLESLKTGPKQETAAANEGEKASPPAPSPRTEPVAILTGRPLLDNANPKFRIQSTEGGGTGIPLDFASATDRSLFLATQPTRGKISIKAGEYLAEQGYKPDDISRYGDELRSRIAELAKNPPAEGYALRVEALEPEATAGSKLTRDPYGRMVDPNAKPPQTEGIPESEQSGHPLLDNAAASYGVNKNGAARAVPLRFASPEDKALYLATAPKRGLIATAAERFLSERNYTPEMIQAEGNRLRDQLDGHFAEHGLPGEGETFRVPAEPKEGEGVPPTTAQVQAEERAGRPAGRLPTPPREILQQSNNAIRAWAVDNGYDVSRIAKEKGQGKYAIKTELLRQMEAGVHRPGPATLPPEAQSWDAGRLRQWASANGIDIPAIVTRESVSRPNEPARKALFRFIASATGMGEVRQSADSLPQGERPAGADAKSNPAPSAPGREPQMLPGEKPDERLARNDDDELLSRVMKGAYRVTSGLGAHQEFLDVHKELTGQDAIPYAGGRGRGFRAEGKTFYNVEQNTTPQLRREAIAHEATHHLQDTRPDLVNQLDRAIPEDTRADLLKEYQKSYQRQEGKALSTDMHAKEIQALAVGRIFSRPSVARQVMQENPGLFTRAADTVITKLRNLTSGGRLTNQVVEFLKNAREQSAKLAAERGESATRRIRESDAKDFLPEPSQRVRDEAEEYTRKAGIPYTPNTEYTKVDEGKAQQIADHYAAAKHEPNAPEVKKSYDALKRESLEQFNFLKDKGVKFQPWKGEGQPYADSAEMMKDVRDNKHLYFFQGGDLPEDHPLAERAPGTPYTYNDVFRAVHDYFGHTKEGVGFGPRGEENAWRSHSQMYSEAARPAMTTETRGQNSWVNFGPHGDFNRANPTKTIYAEQKATTLPPEFTKVERSNEPTGKDAAFLPEDIEEAKKRLRAAGHTVEEGQKGLWILPSGEGVSKRNAGGASEHWEAAANSGLTTREHAQADQTGAVAALVKRGWLRISGKGYFESWGIPQNHAKAIVDTLERTGGFGGEAIIDDLANHKSYSFDTGSLADNGFNLARTLRTARVTPLTPEAGTPSFLPGGKAVKAFSDEDVKPRLLSAGRAIADGFRGLKNVFGQQSGVAASDARGIWRHRGAELQQRADRIGNAFLDTASAVDRTLTKDEMRASVDAWEKGLPQPKPELQPAVDGIKELQDDRWQQIAAMGEKHETGYIEDYYRHQWKDPEKAGKVLAGLFAQRRPLAGNQGFRKGRTYMLQSDGIAAGLEPLEENPIKTGMLAINNMDKYITAHTAKTEMEKLGHLKDEPDKGVPEGWARINDRIFRGKIAPEPVASLTNNLLDPGLKGHPDFGGIARGLQGASNVANMYQLGLNLYHASKTAYEAWKSAGALGTRNLLSLPSHLLEGDFAGAAKDVGGAAKNYALAATGFGPAVKYFMAGSKIRQEWLKPGSTDPNTAAMTSLLKEVGGRGMREETFRTGFTRQMMDAWGKGNVLGAAVRIPPAILEQAAKPLMEHIVPKIKAGAAAEVLRREMADLGPHASVQDIRAAGGRAWDSIENRFGEMTRKNLFWNKWVLDTGDIITRALPYNLGTAREFGGGAKDILGATGSLVTGNVKGAAGKLRSNQLAYSLTSPVMAALAGGLTTYFLTGKAPQTALDYFYPKTGNKDKDGHDERLRLPNYENDLYSFYMNPGQTLTNKQSPLLNTLSSLAQNHDYFGTEIAHPDDSLGSRIAERVEFVGKSLEPIGIRSMKNMLDQGQGMKSLLPMLGITHARRDITHSPAEIKAQELMEERMPRGTRTQEQADRSQKVRDLASLLKAHDSTAYQKISDAVGDGRLTAEDVQEIRDRQKFTTPLAHAVSRLGVHEAMQVWKLASDDEKRSVGAAMLAKVRASKVLTRDERVKFMRALQDDQATLRGGVTTAAGEEN